MKFAFLPRPAIIAHRGASLYAPENTLAAFKLAIEQGAHAIELDTKLSADGHPVVIHDQTVDRTTNASGRVSEHSLADLRALDAGSFFGPEFKSEGLPSLDDVFSTVGGKIPINVELTNYASPTDDLPRRVAELVTEHHLVGSVFFSSFNPLALWRARRLLPEVPIALLALPGPKGALARSRLAYWLGSDALHPEQSDVDGEVIARAHRRGVRVHAYTVNEPGAMRKLLGMGLDGIFTDDPVSALKILPEILP